MQRSVKTSRAALVGAALVTAVGITPSAAAVPQESRAANAQTQPVITVEGQPFFSWQEYTGSTVFQATGKRCAIPERAARTANKNAAPPSDCSLFSTNPSPAYDPVVVLDIPVVVHVIQRTNGQGFISQGLIQSQIDVLNEDFLALAGSPGQGGTNTLVQFHLATVDPGGAPTNGITYSSNDTWFNDSGSYWNSLAWDTNKYMNVYTNSASGALGYVPNLPQGGIVGGNSDRIVVLWSAFGFNAPIGAPYNKGRTLTHEVGHYLGLEHTFSGGCGSASNCYTTGDLICDTNQESGPNFGCGIGSSSCGSTDPVQNYMDYSDDLCMNQFTLEQTRRMRCTLEFYRPNLALPSLVATNYCSTAANSFGSGATISAAGSSQVAANDFTLSVSGGPPNNVGIFFLGLNQTQAPFGDGFMCFSGGVVRILPAAQVNSIGEASMAVDLSLPYLAGSVQPGLTNNFQYWYRDPGFGSAGFNLSDALSVTWQ